MSNDSDWIEWGGGDCPVDPDTIVEARLRNGEGRLPDSADEFRWSHAPRTGRRFASNPDKSFDIIAYRVVKQP